MTGGRLKRVLPYVGDEAFCLTYGDGVADIDIGALRRLPPRRTGRWRRSPRSSRRAASARSRSTRADRVTGFREKPRGDGGWINGGFFVLSAEVGRYIAGDDDGLGAGADARPRGATASSARYRHAGFWQPMDTLRDRSVLEELWDVGRAPWRTVAVDRAASGAGGACSSPATPASRARG